MQVFYVDERPPRADRRRRRRAAVRRDRQPPADRVRRRCGDRAGDVHGRALAANLRRRPFRRSADRTRLRPIAKSGAFCCSLRLGAAVFRAAASRHRPAGRIAGRRCGDNPKIALPLAVSERGGSGTKRAVRPRMTTSLRTFVSVPAAVLLLMAGLGTRHVRAQEPPRPAVALTQLPRFFFSTLAADFNEDHHPDLIGAVTDTGGVTSRPDLVIALGHGDVPSLPLVRSASWGSRWWSAISTATAMPMS